jgi:hypothetical protein
VPPESLEVALAAQDWADLSQRLTRYAHTRMRKTSWASAEEIAQQAIVQLLDPAYASWDREHCPDIFDCRGSIVNGLVQNQNRLKARRGKHVALREDDATHDDELEPLPGEDERSTFNADSDEEEQVPEGPPPGAVHLTDARTAEDLLTQRPVQSRREEIAMAMLHALHEGDTLCLALLARMKDRKVRAAADAIALGVPVAELYEARRRLRNLYEHSLRRRRTPDTITTATIASPPSSSKWSAFCNEPPV